MQLEGGGGGGGGGIVDAGIQSPHQYKVQSQHV